MEKSTQLKISYITVSTVCRRCGGKCYDENQEIRQSNFRKTFPGIALPDKCVDSCTGKTMCPAALGAL